MASTAQINIKVDAGQATKTVGQLNEQVTKAAGSAASLKAELRKTVQELQTLAPGSARFKELSIRAGELKDQIADTNAVVGVLAGNVGERLFKGITSMVQVGVAGFQALQAGIVLFGGESEKLQETMVKLTALLNLSQALETFSALPDRVNEIKAAFGSLTTTVETNTAAQELNTVAVEENVVATEAEVVAQEANVVATTQATIATRALGVAMKALPLIAIAAALITVIDGISDYYNGADELEKKEKERAKTTKETIDRQKQLGGEYTKQAIQVNALKGIINDNTKTEIQRKNALSELTKIIPSLTGLELTRKDALSKVNSETDIYLKNLGKQLEAEGLLQQGIEFGKRYAEAKAAWIEAADILSETRTRGEELLETLGFKNTRFEDFQKAMDIRKKQMNNFEKAIAETTKAYQELMASNMVTTTTTTKKPDTKALKDYSDILANIARIQKEALDAENSLFRERAERGEEGIDIAKREYDQRTAEVKKLYDETRKSILKEYTDKKEQKKKLEELDTAYNNYKTNEEKRYLELIAFNAAEQVRINKEKIKSLIDEQNILQTQILASDGQLTDTLSSLETRRLQIRLNNINAILELERQSMSSFEDLQNEKLELTLQVLQQERDERIKIAEQTMEQQLKTDEERLNSEKQYQIQRVKQEDGTYKYTVQLTEKELKKKTQMTEEQQKQVEELRLRTEDILNGESENLYEQYLLQKAELDNEYLNNYQAAVKKTEKEIRDERIQRMDEVLAFIENSFNTISSQISEFAQQNMEISLTQLNDANKLALEQLNQQLEGQLITREEYDNKVEQLNQQRDQKELQIKRKNFRTEKALNIVGATIDGARAVLSAFANTTGGIVIKSIAAALAGVFAATQIALIARQEFRAAVGGIVPGNGSGEIDSVPARLAPGEAVINSRSSEQFLPLLSAINEMGGGRSFMPDLPATSSSQKFQPVFSSPSSQPMIRAYVVENDISSAQKRINRIERSTTF